MSLETTLFAQFNSTVSRIQELTVDMSNAVNNALRWYPNPLRERVLREWDRFVDHLEEQWETLRFVAENPGSPMALRRVASAWSEQVGGPISGLEGYANLDYTHVDRYWEGEAAEAYLNMLPAQRDAIAHMSSAYSRPASDALDSMATSIVIFWIAVVGALGILVVGIIKALAASSTGVGVPPGIGIALLAVLGFAGTLATGVAQLVNSATSHNTKLLQALNDNSGLRGESWPTTDLGR